MLALFIGSIVWWAQQSHSVCHSVWLDFPRNEPVLGRLGVTNVSIIAAVAVVRHCFRVQTPFPSTQFANINVIRYIMNQIAKSPWHLKLSKPGRMLQLSSRRSLKRPANSGTALCTKHSFLQATGKIPLRHNFVPGPLHMYSVHTYMCFLCHARYQLFLGSNIIFILLLLHLHVV